MFETESQIMEWSYNWMFFETKFQMMKQSYNW